MVVGVLFTRGNGSFKIQGLSSFFAFKLGDDYPFNIQGKLPDGDDYYQLVMRESGGHFGKQVGDKWNQLWEIATKSDLDTKFTNTETPPITTDCNNCTNIISFIASSTENTPYKQVGSGSTEGLLLSVKPIASGVYNAQFAFINGAIEGKRIWYRGKTNTSSWSNWEAIA